MVWSFLNSMEVANNSKFIFSSSEIKLNRLNSKGLNLIKLSSIFAKALLSKVYNINSLSAMAV